MYSSNSSSNSSFFDMIVPTNENVSQTVLLKSLALRSHPVLFIGDSGTGKTVTIRRFLDYLHTFSFSFSSSSNSFKNNINSSSTILSIDNNNNNNNKIIKDINNNKIINKKEEEEEEKKNNNNNKNNNNINKENNNKNNQKNKNEEIEIEVLNKNIFKFQSISIPFSSQTDVLETQHNISEKISKRQKQIFGPKIGTHLIVYIDDISSPTPDRYGSHPPIELLREFLDYNGWYSVDSKYFKHILDLTIVASMGLPDAGKHPISKRFLRHFVPILCPTFSKKMSL